MGAVVEDEGRSTLERGTAGANTTRGDDAARKRVHWRDEEEEE